MYINSILCQFLFILIADQLSIGKFKQFNCSFMSSSAVLLSKLIPSSNVSYVHSTTVFSSVEYFD